MPNYAQISETLVDHPKTTRLMRNLRVNRMQLIGHLSCLWNWALKNAPDGDLSKVSERDIADAARWTNKDDMEASADTEASRFVGALIDCRTSLDGFGFLERDADGNLRLHDWVNPNIPTRLPWFLWSIRRQIVFLRDNFTCAYCGIPLGHGDEIECDHIIPVSRGGSNEISNLATSCLSCNRRKGSKTLKEWRK